MSSNCVFLRPSFNKARRQLLSSTSPKLINGDTVGYPGGPALREDAQFPMSNVLLAGRTGTIWAWDGNGGGNAGFDIIVEIDTGSLTSILAAGILGSALAKGSAQPQACDLEYLPGNVYNATTGWLVAVTGVASLSARDTGTFFGPVSARYWRFRFRNAAFPGSGLGFSVSSLVLSSAKDDLGFLYSGADEIRVRPRTLVEAYDRSPSITIVGPEYRRWSLRYDNNDAALRQTFDNLYGATQPFVFVTPDGVWNECVWDREDFSRGHIWSPPDRYRFAAEIRGLS